jgi:signal peptidase II
MEPASPRTIPSNTPPSATPAVLARIYRYRWLLILTVVIFTLDQITKVWINHTLPFDTYFEPGRITVIPSFFHLVHVGNTGAAWGMFAGKTVWLALLAVGTLVAIYFFRHHLELRRTVTQVCFGLLCGGIVGNLVDRIVHKHVIDFLLFTFGSYDFPAFNIADSAICVGVAIYLFQSFREPQRAEIGGR